MRSWLSFRCRSSMSCVASYNHFSCSPTPTGLPEYCSSMVISLSEGNDKKLEVNEEWHRVFHAFNSTQRSYEKDMMHFVYHVRCRIVIQWNDNNNNCLRLHCLVSIHCRQLGSIQSATRYRIARPLQQLICRSIFFIRSLNWCHHSPSNFYFCRSVR